MGRISQTLGALAIAAIACSAEDKIRVVAATTTLKSIADAVGGDQVDVTAIAAGVEDPHFVEPKPTYITLLSKAEVLLVNGLTLEVGWIPPLVQGSRNPRLNEGAPGFVDCSKGISAIELPAAGTTRAEGDVHPLGNPHYQLDPIHAKTVAKTMADAFAQARPDAAKGFRERCDEFCRKIDAAMFGQELVDEMGADKLARMAESGELWDYIEKESLQDKLGGWMKTIAGARGKKFVTYHKNFSYFVQRFGIEVVEWIEPKPGIPPSAAHLVELVNVIKEQQVGAIARCPFNESKSSELLAEKTGARAFVVPIDVGGAEGTDDYFKLIDRIVAEFGGTEGP